MAGHLSSEAAGQVIGEVINEVSRDCLLERNAFKLVRIKPLAELSQTERSEAPPREARLCLLREVQSAAAEGGGRPERSEALPRASRGPQTKARGE